MAIKSILLPLDDRTGAVGHPSFQVEELFSICYRDF